MLVKHMGSKVNFIDRLDQYVGFDMAKPGCENCGYFICTEDLKDISDKQAFDKNLVFDDFRIKAPPLLLKNKISPFKKLGITDYAVFQLSGDSLYYLVLYK
ncbi:hypothetical protein BI036_gp134 [Morganella phage vB_MmoM_MP1]|uniref:Uncharacterized protein n=1 Tax=Morganella phage vB_MmoM_MP1 TaxID=1852628 RepID=A0A192YBR8_9CAUD|nr:hypothetical protein BI036_gp134 [Morganella phage vB_MmoM_MP1]ANM46570.1 hypothetical protein MP1_gp0260 [Morganella phage vB_MmoM_MP1]